MKGPVFVGGLLLLLLSPAIRVDAASISLVNHTNTWRYRKGAPGIQSNWKTVAESGLDATWLSGQGGIGFADNAPETAECRTLLTDMRNNYSTVAMRRTIQVTSNIDSSFHLVLTMDWDDGFIAWLDGAYVAHALSPGAPAEPAYDDQATGLHESSRGSSGQPPRSFDLGAIGSRLGIGTHVLAIIGLNEASGSSDFIQIADLNAVPPPTNGTSGLIAEDTTWRAADSPIVIAGDVTVNFGITLTIEPGVHVLFNSGLVLAVNGRLLAEGDPTNRIVFSRAPGNAGSWGGIFINGLAESRIRYAHVEFNGAPAINLVGSTAWLDHLTFGTPSFQYINTSGASYIISDCEFPSAATKFEFVRSRDIPSTGYGIIRHNFFGETVGYADVVDHSGGKRPSAILHVINNVFSGATDDALDIDGTDAWIEGNIFQHVHRRGDTPDSSAAVSGGERNGLTSAITVIGNIFYDCDNAATAKQGNFYTFINNTIVHTTNTGGIDFDSGVFNMRDTTPSVTTFGRGLYAEGNIIVDAPQLVRNYDSAQTVVTLNSNILPHAWAGPGTNNLIANPQLRHIPDMSETVFTNWADAQIYRDWFSLQAGSPAIGTGPNGRDQGGVIPLGASISGEPPPATYTTNTTLVVGVNRTGFGIPTSPGWPAGSGYTHYKYRVDGGSWSAERPIGSSILLRLPYGTHYVDVVGKRDSGLYQDDPRFGPDAIITRSRTWMSEPFRISAWTMSGNQMRFQFPAHAGENYSVQYHDALDAAPSWATLTNVPAQSGDAPALITDPSPPDPTRFYRVRTPAEP